MKISVLLPTRGRTTALQVSINSLLDLADQPDQIEVLLAMDRDDESTVQWVREHILPHRPTVQLHLFRRMGYQKIHIYVNTLAGIAQGDWLMAFNDDAQMETSGWDSLVYKHDDHPMPLLRIPCSNFQHPFALFPIVKRQWLEVNGHLSYQVHYDRFMYNVAQNMCEGIVIDLPATIFNDRADLTGNNRDATFAHSSSSYTEGNPADPCNDDYHVCFVAVMHTVNKFYKYLNDHHNYQFELRDLSKPLQIVTKSTGVSHNHANIKTQ